MYRRRMSRAIRVLPHFRHFAVTWGLPDQFGGMTSAMLRRSAGFAAAGATVTVLTFDDRLDTTAMVADLRARGVLAAGVDVLHLWDWLAHHRPTPNGRASELRFAPLAGARDTGAGEPGDLVEVELDGIVRRRERHGPDGTLLQVDRYRPDGSLLVSDLRDGDEPGRLGGRSVILCDQQGLPVRGWRSAGGLYRHWLDLLSEKQPSVAIVDSKTAARFMGRYRRKHVAVIHVLHGAHRSGDGEHGSRFSASRSDALLGEFDAIVALTERQRADLVADLPSTTRVAVVPNVCPLDRLLDAPLGRPARTGVVVASLTKRKRVGQAVASAARASVPLDVYGAGPEHAALQRRIAKLGAESRVRLRGHRPDAAAVFRDASFSLLTSSSEGAPLVLVESMAAGCIPIAYDIRYGPRDIIHDGVDGFVVPPGDTEAMAARISEIVGMPERRRARMRRAARRSATRFEQARVTDRWASLIAEIARRRWHVPIRKRVRARGGLAVRRVRARFAPE